MFLSLIENEIQYYENSSIDIIDFDLSSPDTSNNASVTEYSIEQGIKSLLDDSLLAFASAQLVLNYNTSINATEGMLTIGAIRVGTRSYVYVLFTFNLLLILIFTVATWLTSFWADLPLFNYNDLKSVAIASSMGGMDLATQAMSEKAGQGPWMANPKDKRGDDLQVRLWPKEGGPVELVSASGRVEEHYNIVVEK